MAIDEYGATSDWTEGVLSVVDIEPTPLPPTEISVSNNIVLNADYVVSWSSAIGISGVIGSYELQRQVNTEGFYTVYTGNLFIYIDKLSAGSTIQYRVRGQDKNGLWSEWITSDIVSVIQK